MKDLIERIKSSITRSVKFKDTKGDYWSIDISSGSKYSFKMTCQKCGDRLYYHDGKRFDCRMYKEVLIFERRGFVDHHPDNVFCSSCIRKYCCMLSLSEPKLLEGALTSTSKGGELTLEG